MLAREWAKTSASLGSRLASRFGQMMFDSPTINNRWLRRGSALGSDALKLKHQAKRTAANADATRWFAQRHELTPAGDFMPTRKLDIWDQSAYDTAMRNAKELGRQAFKSRAGQIGNYAIGAAPIAGLIGGGAYGGKRLYDHYKQGMAKHAFIGDTVRNLGNKWFESNVDEMLTDPTQRQELFTGIRNSLTGAKSPRSWTSYLNPMSYVKNWYQNDPRSKKFMTDTLKKRLADPKIMAKMFPDAKINWQHLIGPMGVGGAALGLGGLATGSTVAGLGGLGLMGAQAYSQYRKAVDPMTWAQAFAKPENAQQAANQSDSYALLNSLAALRSKFAADELPGGLADNKSDAEYDKDELDKGEEVEFEHTDDRAKAKEIAKDHLEELPDYYTRLDEMEEEGKKELKKALHFGGGIEYTNTDHNSMATSLMKSHFSVPQARESIAKATNVSLHDKFKMMKSLNSSASQAGVSPRGSLKLRDFLPALAGAGLGYLGASIVAPVFGADRMTKKRWGIGSAALGAVVNSLPQLKGFI